MQPLEWLCATGLAWFCWRWELMPPPALLEQLLPLWLWSEGLALMKLCEQLIGPPLRQCLQIICLLPREAFSVDQTNSVQNTILPS